MVALPPDLEQTLASMTDAEFEALEARVRAPDTREAFRDIAKQIVPEHLLEIFMATVNVAKFVTPAGTLDETRARDHLTMLFQGGPQLTLHKVKVRA